MTIDEVIAVLEMQEEILQFNHFTNEDAWELGNVVVSEAKRRGLEVSVCIRLNSGYTVFQYAGNTTTLNNERWMTKKFNTVRLTEKSSMRFYSELQKNGKSMAELCLDEQEYACAGGGFPIRVEEVGVIGAIMVSNQSQFVDHDILIRGLSHYLHIDEVPRIRTS